MEDTMVAVELECAGNADMELRRADEAAFHADHAVRGMSPENIQWQDSHRTRWWLVDREVKDAIVDTMSRR
jgi:hypothetical protein